MEQRSYQGASDIALLQAFNAAANARTGGCGYVQPGDIPHMLFSGNKLFDPAEVMRIWEEDGAVKAWTLTSVTHKGFDAEIDPDLRDTPFEREVVGYAEARTVELMRRHQIKSDKLYLLVHRCDAVRQRLLTEMGWSGDGEPPWVVNRMTLAERAEPALPEGFKIRSVRGVEEAAAVAGVHVASFGSTWTEEMYRRLMNSPGYAAERELVVEAADGTLAAFTVTWHDPVNRTGLFEPVGTHKAYRRMGLGRALLLTGMARMAAAGMEYAVVVNEGKNEASQGLYRACGFQPWHLLDGFIKRVQLNPQQDS